MKFFVLLSVFSLGITGIVAACDPFSENRPICSSTNLYVPIRNFHDPTHYWNCYSAGAEPISLQCPAQEGFLAEKQVCVHFRDWHWTPPCSEGQAD